MSDTPPQPSTRSWKRRLSDIVDLALGISVIPGIIFVARKFGIWPSAFCFGTFGIPFLAIGFNSLNRLLHPERVPARWPDGYPRGESLRSLQTMLRWIWIVGLFTSYVIGDKHPDADMVLTSVAFGSIAWHAILQRYISDRKYIPPPTESRPPKGGWSGTIKGIHSDHWGGRRIPKSDQAQP